MNSIKEAIQRNADEQHKSTLVSRYIIYIGLLALSISVGVVLYWLYAPTKVLHIHNAPFPVRPTTQKADALVFLDAEYCKLLPVTGTVRRSLVSSTVRIMLPLQKDNSPEGCVNSQVPVLIPKQIVPDTYTVHIEVTYQVNPLKQMTETIDSQPFVVSH